MKSMLPIWLAVVLLATSAYGAFWLWRHRDFSSSSGSYAPPMQKLATSDFTLTNQDGQPFRSADLKGEVWVTSFFFVNCPSICFQLNQRLSELRDQFQGQGVRFVSITVDPENDTPAALKTYAQRFGAEAPQWNFLTGEMEEIKRVGMKVFKLPTDDLTHTDRVAIVDRQGRISGIFKALDEHQYELLQKALASTLAESPEPSGEDTVNAASAAQPSELTAEPAGEATR